nr:uncharacterized protein LOC111413100 [Onthophagus taurus]XP_022899724.1 uncharacterized protein LOC111413101 [Onthophagus taurus]
MNGVIFKKLLIISTWKLQKIFTTIILTTNIINIYLKRNSIKKLINKFKRFDEKIRDLNQIEEKKKFFGIILAHIFWYVPKLIVSFSILMPPMLVIEVVLSILLIKLKLRYQLINKLYYNVLKDRNKELVLIKIPQLHLDLHKIADLINGIYKTPLLIWTGFSIIGTIITSLNLLTLRNDFNVKTVVYFGYYTISSIAELFFGFYRFISVEDEAKKIGSVLLSSETNWINRYLMNLTLNQFEFCNVNFLLGDSPIKWTTTFGILTNICTYVVILIQFNGM